MAQRSFTGVRGTLLRGCVLFGIALLIAVTVVWFSWANKVHQDTERQIMSALRAHYSPASVEVLQRKENHFGGTSDWSFGGQICFDVNVHEPIGETRRSVAQIADGDDGGAFQFWGEYKSLAQCTKDFSHG